MNTNSITKSSHLYKWQTEDTLSYVDSFIGSEIEFKEKCGRRQKVVGILVKCDNRSYHLTEAKINGEFFGDYVISDYEVSQWRLILYNKREKPKKSRPINRHEMNDKYLLPNHLVEVDDGVDEEKSLLDKFLEEPYNSEEVEVIDLNEDEEPLHINIELMSQKASNQIVFIHQINEDLDEVILQIMKCNSVGFAVFGEDVSRDGTIDLMSFSTPDFIYVFDCNNDDIVSRLKPILESKNLQKVMFALRLPSDALYHLFDIELDNAVDIRIWDFSFQKKQFVSTQMSVKPELRTFEAILWLYLRIKVPKDYRNIDFKLMSTKIENYIRLKTVFLRELFAVINHKMLEDVHQINNRCLRSLRSAEGLEYLAVKSDNKELEIIDNPNAACDEAEQRMIGVNTNKSLSNGFKGKEIVMESDDVIIIDSDDDLDEILVRLTPK